MRVLRRIAGQPKYKAGQWTDEKVRACLNMTEILCYISQNRLCYLAQLAKGCGTCGVCFEGDRALRCHEQVAHKKGTTVKNWAPVSGTCCVCGIKFSTRLRLIAHLSDSRPKGGKPHCRASLGRYNAIDNGDVEGMDELDRQARRVARRVGRSQPRSAGPAYKRPISDQEDRPKKRRLTFKQSVSV